MSSPWYQIGATNATAGSTTLAVPVTTASNSGDLLIVASASGQTNSTGVTDSTGGNTYSQIQTDSAAGFHQFVYQGVGNQVVGVSLSVNTYADQTTVWGAASEFDTFLGARPFGFNVQKIYFTSQSGASAGLGTFPSATQGDDQGVLVSALQANGIKKVLVSLRPATDANSTGPGTGYTTSSVTPQGTAFNATTEYNNLVTGLTYLKSIYPNAQVTLWQEPNNGKTGFTPATYQALWDFYAPAVKASGLPLVYDPSLNSVSYVNASNFFNNNGTLLNPLPDIIAVDNYCSDWAQMHNGVVTYHDYVQALENLADAHGLPFAWWETGVSANTQRPGVTDIVNYIEQQIIQRFQARLAAGKPCGDILWYDYGAGANGIDAGTSTAQINEMERLYDLLNETTCAIPNGGTVTITYAATTGVKLGVAVGITNPESGTSDRNVVQNGTSTTPSASSGTLSFASEAAIAISATASTGLAPAWAGGWTPIVTEQTGTSPYLSVAAQTTTGTGSVTASSTITSAAWQMILITFPLVISSTVGSGGLTLAGERVSGSGSTQATLTGSGSLSIAGTKVKGQGVGSPGTVYLIGSNTATSATSMTVPVNTGVTQGDSIQVGVSVASTTSVPSVGPDTAGNVYTLVESNVASGAATLYIFESDGANPMTQSVDTIPVTQTLAVNMGAVAVGDNGVNGFDKFVIAAGTSTAPASPSTGTLSQAEEHAIAWIVDGSLGGNPTWAAPWASNVLANVNYGSIISVAFQRVNANTALTASGTISSSVAWTCGLVTTTVAPLAMTLFPSGGIIGIPYSQTLETSGGTAPISWSVTAGSLPPGITLASGILAGLPTTMGTYNFTLTATDAFGETISRALTVQIVGGSTGSAPMTQFSNNLLSPSDSDFETPNFSWSEYANASAPQITSSISLTGGSALYWTSLKDGPTSIAATGIGVEPGQPCIFSGGILRSGPNICDLKVAWFDGSIGSGGGTGYGNLIQTDTGPTISANPGNWTPLQGAFTAPPGAAFAVPIVAVQDSNAGDVNVIDTMFFTQDDTQILVDWTNPPFLTGGMAGNSFMDVSPWVRMDNNGVTYTRGRQDSISEISGASGSFDLQSDLGQFSPSNSTSLPVAFGGLVTLQRRVQINFADEQGNWWTRLDGAISEVDPTFDNTGNTALLSVMITDVISPLNRQDPLFCWTVQQTLTDNPLYQWRLDDSGTLGGAGVGAETSGNNGPPLRVINSDTTAPGGTGAATISWQDTSAGVETLADAASATGADASSFWTAGSNQPSSALRGLVSGNIGPFTAPIASVRLVPFNLATSNPWPTGTQTAQNTFVGTTGYMLTTELSQPIAPTAVGNDYSFEIWMMPDPTIANNLSAKYGPFIALGLGSSSTKTNLLAGLFLNGGANPNFECATYSQPPAFLGLNWPGAATPTATASTSTAFVPDKVARPHHILITVQGDPTAAIVTLWLDGTNVGNFTLPKGQTYDTICIGGAYGGTGTFYGNLSVASIYPYMLSQQQITQHCMLGQYGMWEQTTDDCIALLSQLGKVPSFWTGLGAGHVGLTMAEYFDITNATAISAMQQFEQAEGGLLFANAAGALTFHTRSWRMGARGPDLLLPPNVFDANLQYRLVDQFQTNEEGVSGPNTLGATATTLLANVTGTAPGTTTTQTTTSTVIQAGYVNTASQNQYGVYASNPVSSPLTLPLVTWSRGYAALGLPSYAYWPDPGLSDRAAWDSNSRSSPWFLPTGVTVDLLTLDSNTGLAKSNFFALEIDNMIAPTPATLPPSFPNAQTSVEWFIEGITETKTVTSHTIEFYTSPAEPQRAWIPGDPTYGVLGQTTQIGISTADLSPTQAYGKSVSHDGGPPYWPPTFSTVMNQPGAAGTLALNPKGFVGASDIRGIVQNLKDVLKPAMCVVGTVSQTQSFTNGALTGTSPPNISTLYWDTVFVDTAGGMGAVPGWPNWYLVTQAGYYEIDACVTWSLTGSGLDGYTGQAWIVVGQAAAQAIAAGTGTPLTVDQYVCPVGEAVRFNASSMTPVDAPTTQMYLGVGDMVCVSAEQNFTSARGTSTAGAGSSMSIRRLGMSKMDDRTLINTSLGSTGSVSLVSHGALQQATFGNTHTYAYMGDKGFTKNGRRNTDLGLYQGLIGAADLGSQCGQITFNVGSMQALLSGHTILSATLTGTNTNSFYTTGAKLMLGTTKDTPGSSTFDPDDSHSTPNIIHQLFTNAPLTFNIPASMVTAFITGGALAFCIGDGDTSDLNYAGQWTGGPGSWTLVVNYV